MRRSSTAFRIGVCIGLVLLLTPSLLRSQPFSTQVQIAINQLTTGVVPFTLLRNAASAYVNWGATSGANGYGFRDNAGVMEAKNSGGAWLPLPTSSTLPTAASFLTRVVESNLSNEFALAGLATALLVNTTTTGVPVAYGGTSCSNQFPRALSAIGAATCASIVLTADVTGVLPVANGGTGLASGTSGGVLYYSATGTLASSGVLTANRLVVGGGAGATPTVLGAGTTTTILHGNAAGAPSFGAVVLTTDVSGILPGANGGTANGFFAVTGPTTSLKTFTLPDASATILTSATAVTPAQGGTGITSYTIGDLLQASGATTLAALAATSTGNALISGGVGTVSAWGKIGLTTHITGTLAATNGGTGLASYTTGDLLYASSGTALAARAAVGLGQVLISQGVATAPVWSATARLTSLHLGSANLTFSGTAPTVTSGFGTTPGITGTATAFRITIGTGGTDSVGVVGLPTAATGWNCVPQNLTGQTANVMDQRTVQLSSSTTGATLENQTVSTGAALAWTAADVLAVVCAAY